MVDVDTFLTTVYVVVDEYDKAQAPSQGQAPSAMPEEPNVGAAVRLG